MIKHRKQPGYLIVESLISITVLLMVTATAIALLIAANRAVSFNANSLEASWVSQEGVNGLRGLRDTNWIRFGYDKEACWIMKSNNCTVGNEISAGNYIIETSLTDPPTLTNSTANLNDGITAADDDAKLYYQIDGTISHNPSGEESIYYRVIEVQSVTPALIPNQIDAIVHVSWLQRHTQKTISLPVTLTNYLLEE